MKEERADYRRIIELLKKSKPSTDQLARMEDYIIEHVEKGNERLGRLHSLTGSLFGWVHIPLARRILVAASFILVGIFIIQQSVLLNQVKNISRQVVVLKNETKPAVIPDIGSRMMLFRISDQFRSGGKISVSGKELERLIEAYNELDGKYQDLLKIVQENPELREYVEKKLEERNIDKANL